MSDADFNTLVDMGFPGDTVKRALEVTNYKGVEPAMEWLLAHGGDASSSQPAPVAAISVENNSNGEVVEGEKPTTNEVAKSLKCEDCGKLFKGQAEVEFHAAKSGHSNFSESTEEKKPLTEEERQEQLALIEQKLKLKRTEREEKEKLDALERERNRIKSGKDMTEAKKRMEELEMKKILEQRKREKQEEKVARDRVKAQIEADKAARKARLTGEQPENSAVTSTTNTPLPPPASLTKTPPKDYTSTRIQIRLHDGSTLTETFSVKEQLSAVRVFIQMKQGADLRFGLMTTFPRKVFEEDDYDKPLEVLGLVPSAVLIVTKSLA